MIFMVFGGARDQAIGAEAGGGPLDRPFRALPLLVENPGRRFTVPRAMLVYPLGAGSALSG